MRQGAAADHVAGQRADRRALAEVVDLVDDGVYDAASVLAWEIQRSSPGDPSIWLLLARIDLLRERHAAAIYAARMATRLDPSSADAWIVLAQTAVRRERWWTEGVDAALQATALAPDDPEPWTALARLQLAAGERYDAAVSAERAVRTDEDHRGAHVVLGEIALDTGEWRHAAAAFRRALELDGEDHDARVGLATALEAQDIDPADELARYGAPVVLRRRGAGVLARGARIGGAVSHPLVADNRRLLLGVGACLLAGLVIGALIPTLGALRGLVGAIAVLLMWFAVGPLRTRRVDEVDVAAADAARDEVIEATAAASGAAEPEPDEAPAAAVAERTHTTRATSDPAGAAGGLSEGEWGPAETPSAPDDEVDDAADVDDDAPTPAAAGADAEDAPDAPTDERAADRGVLEPSAEVMDHRDEAVDDDAAEEPSGGIDGPADTAADDDTDAPRPATDPAVAAEPDARTDAGPEVVELPHDPDALIELSRERLAASDLEAAHAAASRLEAVAPGTVEAHRALGAVALAEHDYDQARAHYAKILELEPLDQEAHERLAMIGEERPRGRLRRFRGWR